MKWFLQYFPKLWTRQKPDGRKAWGALRYLVFGGLFCAAGFWCVNRLQNGGTAGRSAALIGGTGGVRNPAAGNIQLAEVAQSAQDTQPVRIAGSTPDALASSQVGLKVEQSRVAPAALAQNDKNPSTGSTDGFFGAPAQSASPAPSESPRTSGGANDGNNSIFAAMSRSEQATEKDGRPAVEEETAQANKPTTPRPPGSGNGFGQPSLGAPNPEGGNAAPQIPSIESLVIKDSRAPVTSTSPPVGGVSLNTQPALPKRFLPRGEIIPVYLMETVITGRFPTLVQFAVAKTIWFNGKPIIPFGTRFLGTAGLGTRDRITFNIDSLRRRDGLEIACNALVLGTDKATGIQAYYIPPEAMAQAAPYIASFTQAYADIMKARATKKTIQVGTVSITDQPSAGSETREILLATASEALGEFVRIQLADVRERYPGYMTLPAGSAGYVQLTANTEFTALWDPANKGVMLTVGTPDIISTESVYRQRDQEKANTAIFAEMLNPTTPKPSASNKNDALIPPPSTATPAAAPAKTTGVSSGPIKDPFSN